MKQVNIIDKEGYIVSNEIVDDNNNFPFSDYKLRENERIIENKLSCTLLKPRWDGFKWVEGATSEEIETHREKTKENNDTTTINDRVEELEASLAELSITLAQKGVL